MIRRTLVALALALCASCSLLQSDSLSTPPESFVRGSRAAYSVLAPRLAAYLREDPNLSEFLREVLLFTISDWEYLIRKGEETLGGPPAGLPPVEPAPSFQPGDTVPTAGGVQ